MNRAGIHGNRPLLAAAGAGGVAVLLTILAVLSCNRLIDSLRPFSRSAVAVTGTVYDSIWSQPIAGAMVRVGDEGGALTDSSGEFFFGRMVTGAAEIMIAAPGYDTLRCSVDITLDMPPATYRLVRTGSSPVIERLHVDTAGLRFSGDSLVIAFTCHDSSGGIRGVTLTPGDSGATEALEHWYDSIVYALDDSFSVVYTVPGNYMATLRIIGGNQDTTTTALRLELPQPRKPTFARLRSGTDGFVTGAPGYLQISVDDPDSAADYLTIDWGDGSAPLKSIAHQGTFWHVYSEEQKVTVTVGIHDAAGVLDTARLDFQVITINPPLLDSKLFFKPGQYCAPHDSVILIGVTILDIKDNWAKQIIWIVNENDPPPAFAYHRDTLTAQTGAISDSVGNRFVHAFPTAGFKGTNLVEVRVVDGLDNSSTVSGTFFIAGKGN